jgi:Fe/S biogenesis protein NfuA
MIRHYLPDVMEVRIANEGGEGSEAVAIQQQVQEVLDTWINPAVKVHGGAIRLETVDRGTVRIRFEGACQGCAMAEVTLRQGVEVLLREHVPGLTSIIDMTDHPIGRNPYFKTRKGTD